MWTNDDGTMNENAGRFQGMTALECREAVVEQLRQEGYLVKIEDYTHNVGTCYRCHHTVDPVTSTQWFVKMEPLARPAIEAVRSGRTKFVPERFAKTYYNWMENIRDWCISRQLWWGHRIPAWYCDECGETVVAREAPRGLPQVRLHAPPSGRGRAGHVVFLRALALLHAGLAGGNRGPQVFLSHQHAGDGLRHHLLLGGPHDLLRHRADGRQPV